MTKLLFCWRRPSDGQRVVATVAQETRRLGEKGIKFIVGLDDLARLSRNNATGCFCLFGRRSHRHGKIVVIVVAACPLIIDGVCLVAWAPLAVVATTLFVASTLVALRPRFLQRRCLTIVALAALPALVRCHVIA